jgi:hypothetical protein
MREETNKLKPRAARLLSICALSLCCAPSLKAQGARGEQEFGPVVRAYLGYLNAEQEVTDARESRREVSAAYVRRNSNRISALRRMAIQLARASHNDYVPELYAVARDELGTLFETPPSPATFRVGEVLNNTFRFLGTVRTNEPFYLFARLDIYEQAELIKKAEAQRAGASSQPAGAKPQGEAATRPRRVSPP